MFLQVSVILSTGGVSASVHAGIPPQEETPPQEENPPGTKHAGRYGQRAGGTHPTGMLSCLYCSESDVDPNGFIDNQI